MFAVSLYNLVVDARSITRSLLSCIFFILSGAVAAGAGMATGALVGRKVRNIKLNQNATELQNLNAAADMAETKELRQEMVTYKASSEHKKASQGTQLDSSDTFHQKTEADNDRPSTSTTDTSSLANSPNEN